MHRHHQFDSSASLLTLDLKRVELVQSNKGNKNYVIHRKFIGKSFVVFFFFKFRQNFKYY